MDVVCQARLEEIHEVGVREKLSDLFIQLFRRPLDVVDERKYQIFWLETTTDAAAMKVTDVKIEVPAMAVLEFEYPVAELKYEFFADEKESVVAVLRSVGTHPNFRGRVLLTKLLDFAHSSNSKSTNASIFLEVSVQNDVAIKLYSGLGFHFPASSKLPCAKDDKAEEVVESETDAQKVQVPKESCTNFCGEIFYLMRKLQNSNLNS